MTDWVSADDIQARNAKSMMKVVCFDGSDTNLVADVAIIVDVCMYLELWF